MREFKFKVGDKIVIERTTFPLIGTIEIVFSNSSGHIIDNIIGIIRGVDGNTYIFRDIYEVRFPTEEELILYF